MFTTSATLLQKLRDPNDRVAWNRFVDFYTPLLDSWARRLPLNGADRADFVQEIFIKILNALPEYQHNPARGKFRSWLKTLCVNHWHDHWRKAGNRFFQATDAQLADLPAAADKFWQQYDVFLIHEACKVIRPELDAIDQTVLDEVVLKARPVKEVAKELGLRAAVVSVRKYRILRRLKQELGELAE